MVQQLNNFELLFASSLKMVCYLEEKIYISKKDALLVTDIQNDFLSGGALPVSNGNEIIPILNDYINLFKSANARIFATRDWHPPNHVSFKEFGGLWPIHCVQNSEGAKFHSDLKLPSDVTIISKATDPQHEAYSSFNGTNLAEELEKNSINRIFIGGLTTDYCIRYSVLDGLAAGFSMFVLSDAIRGINAKPDDSQKAIEEMQQKGARIITVDDFAEPSEIPLEQPEGEQSAEASLMKAAIKKKARLRSRGPYRKTKTER